MSMMWQSGTAEVELKKGNIIKITLDDAYQEKCSDEILWLDYKNITNVVEIGSKIYIDDGLMSLQVKEIGKWRNSQTQRIQVFTHPKWKFQNNILGSI